MLYFEDRSKLMNSIYFQFLLEHMFGTPPEVIHVWLKYRGIPYLL